MTTKSNSNTSKSVKNFNTNNGVRKMTTQAKNTTAQSKTPNEEVEIIKHNPIRSIDLKGPGIRSVEFRKVTPAMAKNILENYSWGEEVSDEYRQKKYERAILDGFINEDNTIFLIHEDDEYSLYATEMLHAIVVMGIDVIVLFVDRILMDITVIIDPRFEGDERFKVYDDEVFGIQDEINVVLKEMIEEFLLKQKDTTFSLPEHIVNALLNIPCCENIAAKVCFSDKDISKNTLGAPRELFAVMWCTAEFNNLDTSFFEAIAFNKPELSNEASEYMKYSQSLRDRFHQLSDRDWCLGRALQKKALKDIVAKMLDERLQKAS